MIQKISGRLRHEKENLLRTSRRLLPYPKFWAKTVGARTPVGYITGNESGLVKPESVAFSPSGKMMVVSNAENAALTLYRKSDSLYENKPFHTITDSVYLNYVHDATFAPSENVVAAVARDSHSLTLYGLDLRTNGASSSNLLFSLEGEEHGLYYPSGVTIHPSGQVLAVANRMRQGISLFRATGADGIFESEPFQTISESDMKGQNLPGPHGLEFSPDGRHLLAVHSKFWLNPDPNQGESALTVYECFLNPDEGVNPVPKSIFRQGHAALHTVSIHPSNETVAIADAKGGVEIYSWKPELDTLNKVDSIALFFVNEGTKGVGITTDGKYVAATTDLNEVLFYDLPMTERS